ncbi:F0F1 ATP synthase subunit A [Phocaeicola faecicola]|jgi:F-type H+-transporting ATPase subunit a|uniref:F0F1 ATP synthase subunit A n=1 Tax=Phocaeicola faecicola TaxID=2739389 RepID=UPI0015B73C95|nr:F0F1 ATP synthase subunit A [Phocaeicola faecicola]MCI5742294.1 F0F1 ATP synthase subunit A [Bacteroides sp.]MDD6907872.1 F0F1 ATP synthase subunit A [Bacteroidaceae bacterium]MDY4872377.1 F0F1 ATP synthase subunit A [Phocaeicola faecicola]
MKKLKSIVLLLLLLVSVPGMLNAQQADSLSVAAAAPSEEEEVNVSELVFGHIGDAYEWHIATLGGKEWSIPLPVIVHSSTGWHVFSSSHLKEGEYEGLYIASQGTNEGKIVERNAAGEEVRPFDISITKNVLGLFINSAVLLLILMSCVRWYKKHPVEEGAPRGGVGMVEAMVLMIYEDVIKGCIGEDYKRYAPYLLTAFFFVLVNNLMGLIPIFPGGANVTGNIAVTLVLAVCTFILTNVYGSKEYWKEIFWPEVPVWLKVPIPMMPVIELFGIFTKPFALMIRLFANIMAGHAAILSLIAIIFITVKAGAVINGSMTAVAVLFGIFMDALEVLVAFIQAYVFTMLSAVFIGLSRVKGSEE